MKWFLNIRRPKYLWRWVFLTIGLLVIASAIFFYLRISSFVDSSFGGRNETSLLSNNPSPPPSQSASITLSDTVTVPAAQTTSPVETTAPVTSAPAVVYAPTPTSNIAPTPTLEPTLQPTPVPSPTPTLDPALLTLVQKVKQGRPTTGLFIGYGGKNHDGPYLTDTIMLVTYYPDKNVFSMVNIPRDLYVLIPSAGPDKGFWGKINSAFAYVMQVPTSDNLSPRYRFQTNDPASRVDAAANLLKDLVEKITNTRVDYWAAFDFTGFIKLVDTIGGVDITVDKAFDDYLYPATDDPNIPYSVTHIHFDAGPQHLNGDRALQFVRSRQSAQDGNDFNRSKRQMKMIQALKERLTRPDILPNALGIMEALQGNFRTSLAFGEVTDLYGYYKDEGPTLSGNLHFTSHILSTDNLLVSAVSPQGSFILYPAAGQTDYSAIQGWLAKINSGEGDDGTG
jgi:LCP family protein required for cell wall assembly